MTARPWMAGLAGQIALVTGAGRGIGRSVALALAESGADVIAVARTAADLETLATEGSGRISTWCVDVTADSFIITGL